MATTSTRPNLYQLGTEVGGSPSFHMVGPVDGVYTLHSSADDEVLQAALDAHVPDHAIAPEPDPEPEPEPTAEERIAQLEAIIAALIEETP
jgi:hypothetical protein